MPLGLNTAWCAMPALGTPCDYDRHAACARGGGTAQAQAISKFKKKLGGESDFYLVGGKPLRT